MTCTVLRKTAGKTLERRTPSMRTSSCKFNFKSFLAIGKRQETKTDRFSRKNKGKGRHTT